MTKGLRSTSRPLRYLDDDDVDPMLSSINLVDLFLVAMVILMIIAAAKGLAPQGDYTLIKNAGSDEMEIVIKRDEQLQRLKASGATREGIGTRAGVAYRLEDGSVVYVPE